MIQIRLLKKVQIKKKKLSLKLKNKLKRNIKQKYKKVLIKCRRKNLKINQKLMLKIWQLLLHLLVQNLDLITHKYQLVMLTKYLYKKINRMHQKLKIHNNPQRKRKIAQTKVKWLL